jgi:hypothetical protein
MAIAFDTSRPIRRPSERVALVDAVLGAHAADEGEWIEWKREIPLGTAKGNSTVARHVLGFSNRRPQDATRFLGGHAYLLVGVEPGNLVGSPAVDPARLEDWLRPYLGDDGPVWDMHNIDVRGGHVVAIEVAPPRDGDPIRTLRKEYEEWHAGAIFVRRKGKTAEANPSEIAMLTARAAAAAERVSVSVSWAAEPVIPALDLVGEAVDQLIAARREALLRPLEAARRSERAETPADPRADAVAGVAASVIRDLARNAALMQQVVGYQPEDRSPEDYRDEVESHVEELRKAAPVVAAARAMAAGDSRLLPRVENPTESNFRGLRVRLEVPGPVIAVDADEEEEWAEKRLPAPPRAWGSMRPPARFDLMSSLASPDLFASPKMPRVRRSGLEIAHGGSATLTFDPIDLRPRDVVELDPFHLFARPELAGEAFEATWEATSTSADSVASGVLPIRVGDESVTLEQLLQADSTDDDEE